MNLQDVRERRLIALKRCNSDRLLVAPAKKKSYMRLPKEQTVAAYMIAALRQGFTIDQLTSETGWSKPRAMTNLYKVAKRTGIGIERRDGILHAVWPEHDVNTSETRPFDADFEQDAMVEYAVA